MNIEQLIANAVTQALTTFFASHNAQAQPTQAAHAPVSAAPAFVPPVAPAVVAAPIFTPPPVAAFTPPPAPPVVAAPAPGACPIVDQKSLVEYVMNAYKDLGPQKGGQIQGVLNNCQVQSINECRPEHYAYIHQCIEQLKAS